jgi:hypothetical protein
VASNGTYFLQETDAHHGWLRLGSELHTVDLEQGLMQFNQIWYRRNW